MSAIVFTEEKGVGVSASHFPVDLLVSPPFLGMAGESIEVRLHIEATNGSAEYRATGWDPEPGCIRFTRVTASPAAMLREEAPDA